MKKKGFTLVELLAAISILAIIGLLAVPNVIKSYNKSKINAITIQENKLVEAGDILLDDYCKDAINDSYKEKCKIYYQELDEYSANQLSTEKDYKYICVEDIKTLEYYTEDLKFGGTACQGVVIYEIDKQTKLQTNSFSYLKCGEDYNTGQGMDTNIPLSLDEKDYINLFSSCFDETSTETEHESNKKYTLTIKYVENDLNGKEIKTSEKIILTNTDYNKKIKAEFTAAKYIRNNNTYEAVINTGGKDIEFENPKPEKDANGNKVYKITKLPKENVTISVVYSVEKHSIVTNYYKFSPNYSYDDISTGHKNFGKMSKDETKLIGYTMETTTLDAPETLNETINGKSEIFNRYLVYIDNEKNKDFNGKLDVGLEDKIVDVIYQRDSFNITYNNNGGEGCSEGTVKYNGEFKNLCTPTREGYTFDYWKASSGDKIENGTKYEIYSDLTLTAVWKANQFKFVFDGNNNNGGSVSNLVCTYDQECKLPNNGFTRTGHSFSSWNLNTSGTGTSYYPGQSVKNYTTLNGKVINLYAIWSLNTYYIAFNPGTGGTGSMSKMTMEYTKSQKLTSNAFTRVGYSFVNWRGSDGKTYTNGQEVSNLTTEAGKTITMTAQWQTKSFNVTFNANGGSVSTSSKTVTYESTYGDLPTATRTGYIFDGWYTTKTCGNKIVSSSTVSITSDQTLYAHWTPNKYTVTFDANGGSVSTSSKTVTYASTYGDLPTATNAGYTLAGWYTGKTGGNKITSSSTVSITSNQTLYAQWNVITYNISFNCNGGSGSTTSMSGIKYGESKALTKNGCSKTGYTFGGWTGSDGKSYSDQQSIKNLTTSNGQTITMTAKWNVVSYTISYDLSDGVKGTYAPTSGNYNSTVTVSNPTRAGWTFVGWTVTGTGASISGTSLKVGSSNVTLKAKFKTHILTYIDYMWNNARSANSLTNADPAGNKRFTGANPNNYVKFNNESWRMIGVFNVSSANRLKISRTNELFSGSFDVSSTSVLDGYGVNDWTQSDIAYTLNNYYLSTSGSTCKYCTARGQSSVTSCPGNCSSVTRLSSTAQAMISKVTWNTGAIHYGASYNQQTYNNISAASAYNAERSSATGKQCTNSAWTYCKNDSVPRYTTWSGKVGLPYPSDWAYASGNSSCKNTLTNSSNCSKDNWLHKDHLWTMTPGAWWNLDNCSSQIIDGELYANWGHVHGPIVPTVYLNTNLYFTGGTGTATNPYIISQE